LRCNAVPRLKISRNLRTRRSLSFSFFFRLAARIFGFLPKVVSCNMERREKGWATAVLTFTARVCTLMHVSEIYDIAVCREALIDHGWEQKDVADRTGLSESAVSKFFRGATVRNSTAAAIIKALGLRVKDVRIGSGNGARELAGERR
jgi:DNA-binding Xre family transcriptional regulator